MKKLITYLLLAFPLPLMAQIGIKGGLNFAKVSKASEISSSNKAGFHAELIFSRQGYDYKNATTTGNVNMDYIQMGQLMSINITKYFSLMLGAQTSYLISAQADSSTGTGSGPEKSIMDLYNRIDYGYAVGVEIHPVLGLIIGARYNVSLAKVYKDLQNMQAPSFTSQDAKNNVIQISVGWRFGKQPKKEKKED